MILILVVSTSVVVAIALAAFHFFNKPPKAIPHIPMSLPGEYHPILGHVHLLEDMIPALKRLTVDSTSVDGLSRFYLFNKVVVAVLKGEHIKAATATFNFRERLPIIDKHIDMLLGKRALVSLMKDEWKVMRKIMTKAFHWEYLAAMVSDMCDLGQGFITALSRKNAGEVLDMWVLLKCLTLDVIGKTGFGFDFNCSTTLTSSPVAEAFDLMLAESSFRQFKAPLDPRYYFYNWPNEKNKNFMKASRTVRGTIEMLIVNRKEQRLKNAEDVTLDVEHKDLLKYMLDAHDEDGVAADVETLTDNLLTLLFGGYDTSSITLTYALYMMTQHRDVEQKVLDEVTGVLGRHGKPSYEDVTSKLPYTTAVINEVLRLFPPAPVTVRTLDSDLDLTVDLSPEAATPPPCAEAAYYAKQASGATAKSSSSSSPSSSTTTTVRLPAGTIMYIPIWWIHRSAFNYSNPDKFDPDRFFDPVRAATIHRYAHIAFSAGGRDCVGKRFAMLELVTVFASMVRSLRFEAIDGYELVPQGTGIVQKPKHNMPLRVFVRE